jgi:hypothetical protein
MNKIINSICTIVCNDSLNALEINFNKNGKLQEYNESMELAMDLSIIRQVNKWIININDFQDLKIESFLMLLFSWSKIVRNRNKENHKVIMITSSEISNKINAILKKDWWHKRYNRSDINIKIFYHERKEFLPLEMVTQTH